MTSTLAIPQLQVLGEVTGNILITVPITNKGRACDAVVNLYIHEGSWLPGAGDLLASYSQAVSFLEGEQKEVVFAHTVIQTDASRRDVGVEVVVGDSVKASAQFDDVYHVPTGPGLIDKMMMIMMMAVMMTVVQIGE
ncbi:hypothetical protein M1O18_02855 [Dehalococcoidia bacterium]|nr:hypothetical protein [Dehalococcoidia bacterium]